VLAPVKTPVSDTLEHWDDSKGALQQGRGWGCEGKGTQRCMVGRWWRRAAMQAGGGGGGEGFASHVPSILK
jgi:hypothetical protein